MPRPDKIGRLARRINDRLDRLRPLLGRDAGLRVTVIDRHGEGGSERRSIRLDHGMQFESFADLGQNGHAKLPTAMRDHEVDDFGSHLLGSADKVSLVLPVLGVNNDDHLAPGDRFHRRVDLRKRIRHCIPPIRLNATDCHTLSANAAF